MTLCCVGTIRKNALNTPNFAEDINQFLSSMQSLTSKPKLSLVSDSYIFSSMPRYDFGYEFLGEIRDYMLYGLGVEDWKDSKNADLIKLYLNAELSMDEIYTDNEGAHFYNYTLRDTEISVRKKYIGNLANDAFDCENLISHCVFRDYLINPTLLEKGENSAFITYLKSHLIGKYDEIADSYLESYYPYYKLLKEKNPNTLKRYNFEIRFAKLRFYIGIAQALSHYFNEGEQLSDTILKKRMEILESLKEIEGLQILEMQLSKKHKGRGSLVNEDESLELKENIKRSLNHDLSWLGLFNTKPAGWPISLLVFRLAHALVNEIGFSRKRAAKVIIEIVSLLEADSFELATIDQLITRYFDWYSKSGLTVRKITPSEPVFSFL